MKPIVSLIVAMTKNNVIGHQNQLPWHLPDDLKHFKALTLNKPIIMGRKTYVSIGKPLPQRQNIVLTQDQNFTAPGITIAHSITECFNITQTAEEIMIIGGASIYQQFLPYATRIYLTLIDAKINGDTFFPEWNKQEWCTLSSEAHSSDEKHQFGFSFVTLSKKG